MHSMAARVFPTAPPCVEWIDAHRLRCDGGSVEERADSAAVGELFRKHGPMVFRRAYRILGRREDAEEAMHEVFIRVMRGADRFEGRSGMSTWLYQITTNYCLNLLRVQPVAPRPVS